MALGLGYGVFRVGLGMGGLGAMGRSFTTMGPQG